MCSEGEMQLPICFIILILNLRKSIGGDTDVLRASWSPMNSKVEIGSTWSFSCIVSSNISIIWYRHVGDLTTKVAFDETVDQQNFASGGLLVLNKEKGLEQITYTLKLLNAQLEDSGVYQCVSSYQQTANQAATVIVCDDPSQSYCDCMVSEKWANPSCFPQDAEDMSDYYKNTLAGLGIALAVTAVYAVAVGLVYGRDCMLIVHQKRMQKQLRIEATKQNRSSKTAAKSLSQPENCDTVHLDPKQLSSSSEDMFSPNCSSSETSGYSGSNKSSNDSEAKKEKRVNFRNKKFLSQKEEEQQIYHNAVPDIEADVHIPDDEGVYEERIRFRNEESLSQKEEKQQVYHNAVPEIEELYPNLVKSLGDLNRMESSSEIPTVSKDRIHKGLYPDLKELATNV